MTARLVVDASPFLFCLGRIEDERLTDVVILDRADGEVPLGALARGRVRHVRRDLRGAFVDLGPAGEGFLPGDADGAVSPTLPEGTSVFAEVLAEGRREEGKWPRLDTRASLRATQVVLKRGLTGAQVSRRATDAQTRARLQSILLPLARDRLGAIAAAGGAGWGLIARTGADPDAAELIAAEVDWLAAAAARAEAAAAHEAPGLLTDLADHLRTAFVDLVRLGVDEIVLESGLDAARLEAALGPHRTLVRRLSEAQATDLWPMIDAATARAVALPTGGRLIFDRTAALTAIDVDSAGLMNADPRTQAEVLNRDVTPVLAQALRLRNLSGQILCDLVGRDYRTVRAHVDGILREALAGDPVGIDIVGFTRLGLFELTRARTRRTLEEATTEPWSDGGRRLRLPVAAHRLARALAANAHAMPGRRWQARVPARLARWLRAGAGAAGWAAIEERRGAVTLLPETDEPWTGLEITPLE